jgi:hypothetical protein
MPRDVVAGEDSKGSMMGWLEEVDGVNVAHHPVYAVVDGERLDTAAAIDVMLRAPSRPVVRSGCTCGWTADIDGPDLPWPARRWLTPDLPHPAVAAFEEYHLRSWQTHVTTRIAGTGYDDPETTARRAIARLLDSVHTWPVAVVRRLDSLAYTVDKAMLLAAPAAARAGYPWARTGYSCMTARQMRATGLEENMGMPRVSTMNEADVSYVVRVESRDNAAASGAVVGQPGQETTFDSIEALAGRLEVVKQQPELRVSWREADSALWQEVSFDEDAMVHTWTCENGCDGQIRSMSSNPLFALANLHRYAPHRHEMSALL